MERLGLPKGSAAKTAIETAAPKAGVARTPAVTLRVTFAMRSHVRVAIDRAPKLLKSSAVKVAVEATAHKADATSTPATTPHMGLLSRGEACMRQSTECPGRLKTSAAKAALKLLIAGDACAFHASD